MTKFTQGEVRSFLANDRSRGFPKQLVAGLLSAAALSLAACSSLGSLGGSSGSSGGNSGSSGGTTSALPVGTIATGIEQELVAGSSMPPGTNNWNCKPSAAHPYPVVLVHGTMGSEAFTWQALSPMLANAGYCVYGLNYGANIGPLYALSDIGQEAGQLNTFVQKVLASTGASKVDIVGHSKGGMMPRYLIQDINGASEVNMMVGLAPSNQGTTFNGLVTLGNDLAQLAGISMTTIMSPLPASFGEQMAGNPFLTALNAGGGTSPGVKYVNIDSKYDEVVTPYTNAFLAPGPNVQNITLQDYCSTDFTEHIGIVYDPVTLALVMNALGADNPSYKPPCTVVLPVIGALGNV